MAEQLAIIRNTGADRLRTAVLLRAAALVVAVTFSFALVPFLPGGPVYLRAYVIAIPVLVALILAGLLVRALLDYLEAPVSIDCSPIIMMVRYRNRPFLGMSWNEIISVRPVKARYLIVGGLLYDLMFTVMHKKNEVVQNLSLPAARKFVSTYHQNAKKLPFDEAERVTDGMFGIERF